MKLKVLALTAGCAATFVVALAIEISRYGQGLAVVGVCLLGVVLPRMRFPWQRDATGSEERQHEERKSSPVCGGTDGPNELVDTMLGQARCALLLRPQIVGNLSAEQREIAARRLDDAMSLVPEGEVVLPCAERRPGAEDLDQCVFVEAFFLDRFAVTNAQYKQFVDAGGYEQISYWETEIMPGMLDFVDQSGHPGPRYWHDGSCRPGLDNHPVAGISWYEAQAYARWVGKRLPTDAEWVKAASWPIASRLRKPIQRIYPWGNSMDRSLANLWGSGPATTVDVDCYDRGTSVNGIYQMVGNVWEWMNCDLGTWDSDARDLHTDEPMKGLRGGAFDTYFDGQATCHFQSGDSLLARKPNIGFRCAVGLCDVTAVDLLDADHSPDWEQEA